MAQAFDLMLLDGASQTDVGHATLFAASMPTGCSVVPAGDTRQLPPITQAQAPMNLEGLVGPFLGLFERTSTATRRFPLDINYRSNATIVALAHVARYDPALRAASPDLNLDLDLDPGGSSAPAGPRT